MGEWKSHGSATGGYYSCNVYSGSSSSSSGQGSSGVGDDGDDHDEDDDDDQDHPMVRTTTLKAGASVRSSSSSSKVEKKGGGGLGLVKAQERRRLLKVDELRRYEFHYKRFQQHQDGVKNNPALVALATTAAKSLTQVRI
jgi:hypothetical protein